MSLEELVERYNTKIEELRVLKGENAVLLAENIKLAAENVMLQRERERSQAQTAPDVVEERVQDRVPPIIIRVPKEKFWQCNLCGHSMKTGSRNHIRHYANRHPGVQITSRREGYEMTDGNQKSASANLKTRKAELMKLAGASVEWLE